MMAKELLFSVTRKDLEVTTFRAGGPGGQHQNKVETGVRIVHRESGAVGESRSERSQHANRRLALRRLAASRKFRLWVNRRVHELRTGETIDQAVARQMAPENIKVEVKNEKNQWVECQEQEGCHV